MKWKMKLWVTSFGILQLIRFKFRNIPTEISRRFLVQRKRYSTLVDEAILHRFGVYQALRGGSSRWPDSRAFYKLDDENWRLHSFNYDEVASPEKIKMGCSLLIAFQQKEIDERHFVQETADGAE